MNTFKGKTAVISGGAEGIGFGIAKAVGLQGMNVVLGDIDAQQLTIAEEKLKKEGIAVLTVAMDVSDQAQWQNLADKAIDRFGKVHMLVNNAGVGGTPGTIEDTDAKDWRWVLDVNLMGVVYGTQTMVPLMKQHGEGGWLINVASMAGMAGVPFAGAYTATKLAVAGMSESWHHELKTHDIHVSVLCPAFVRTRINKSTRNKPDSLKNIANTREGKTENESAQAAHMQKVIDEGLDPDLVGLRVIEAIEAGELYIFTHPNYRSVTQARYTAIDQAFERAAESELLAPVRNQKIVNFS